MEEMTNNARPLCVCLANNRSTIMFEYDATYQRRRRRRRCCSRRRRRRRRCCCCCCSSSYESRAMCVPINLVDCRDIRSNRFV
jgi:hypothetical protein